MVNYFEFLTLPFSFLTVFSTALDLGLAPNHLSSVDLSAILGVGAPSHLSFIQTDTLREAISSSTDSHLRLGSWDVYHLYNNMGDNGESCII